MRRKEREIPSMKGGDTCWAGKAAEWGGYIHDESKM